MLVLLVLLVAVAALIFLFTYISRRNKSEEVEIKVNDNGECCGAHAVCDKDSLLLSSDKVEYFDDEELDVLACVPVADYTSEQIKLFSDVFYTLKETEVAAWLRSLQLRRIELPSELRDEVLLVISERRQGA